MELNEWNFAGAIQKQLQTKDEARFMVLDDTTNTTWDLVAMDDEGNIYYVNDEESIVLHRHLLVQLKLETGYDNVKREVVYKRVK
jgi:hypothetical protein